MAEWAINLDYIRQRGRMCIVCEEPTKQGVAPLGIMSGLIPCHVSHPDDEIMLAWIDWVQLQAAEFVGDLPPKNGFQPGR